MEFETKHYLIIALGAVFLLKKIFEKKPFVKRYNMLISALIVAALAILIAVEFWSEKLYIGILAIGLGMFAILKLMLDAYRKPR